MNIVKTAGHPAIHLTIGHKDSERSSERFFHWKKRRQQVLPDDVMLVSQNI